MRQCFPKLAISAVTAACVSGASFAERVDVMLNDVSVTNVTMSDLYPEQRAAEGEVGPVYRAIRFDISSRANLTESLGAKGRDIQVRCTVVRPETGRVYRDSGFGPFERSLDVGADSAEPAGPDAVFRYTLYAFLGLSAAEAKYRDGRPRSTFDLTSQMFEAVSCQLVGASMSPLPFPRSNAFSVSSLTLSQQLSSGD